MSQKIEYQYFYGNESDMYIFYRIPKLLITDDAFKTLSSDAKILYGLMLDRMSLSSKNGWFDKENRVYIYFSIEDTMEYLCQLWVLGSARNYHCDDCCISKVGSDCDYGCTWSGIFCGIVWRCMGADDIGRCEWLVKRENDWLTLWVPKNIICIYNN